VDELFLVDLDAEFCVFHTAQGVLNRGYKTNIITDCIELRAEEKWDSLMGKYRQKGIALTTSNKFPS
jgi:nicotinamidase-related amidase